MLSSLIAVFTIEGLGLTGGRELTYHLLLNLPLVLWLACLIRGVQLKLPKKLSLFFILFLTFSLLSTIYSLDISRSLPSFLLLNSYFLLFLFSYNQPKCQKAILAILYLLALIFIIHSLLLKLPLIQSNAFFSITHGYQLVFPSYSSHNHLGDFLILPLIANSYFLLVKKRKIFLFDFLLFFPFFLFSYSRSAYLAFFVTLLILIYQQFRKTNSFYFKRKFSSLFLLFSLALSALFFVATVKQAEMIPGISSFNKFLQEDLGLSQKDIFAGRIKYLLQAKKGFLKQPLFGYGLGNFIYASSQPTLTIGDRSFNAHNIFLETLVENGVFSASLYLILIFLLLRQAVKKIFSPQKISLSAILWLILLINFQTDYTYSIYSLMALFFILAGQFYQEKKFFHANWLITLLSVVLFLTSLFNNISNYLITKNNFQLAFYLYPFNNKVYQPLIDERIRLRNFTEAAKYLELYARLNQANLEILHFIADRFSLFEPAKSLSYYQQAYQVQPFNLKESYKKIYYTYKYLGKNEKAKSFINKFFSSFADIRDKDQIAEYFRLPVIQFCQEIYDFKCPFEL